MIISRWILLRMRNVSDKSYRENPNTRFTFSNLFSFFRKSWLSVIMWKNMVEPGWPQTKIWRMRIACWIIKAINTHPEYIIVIAFSLRQWLHKGASILRFTFFACLVFKFEFMSTICSIAQTKLRPVIAVGVLESRNW